MQANPKKELFHIAGDHPSENIARGASGANLTQSALCHPVVLYRGRGLERILILDVFAVPGAPMYAVLYCPLCQTRDPGNKHNRSLTIKADNKKIDLDHKALPNIPGFTTSELVKELGLQSQDELRGRISIETFGCTWEEDPELKRGFGFSCCDWKVVIDNNIARDV
jgi:hypothetical protein